MELEACRKHNPQCNKHAKCTIVRSGSGCNESNATHLKWSTVACSVSDAEKCAADLKGCSLKMLINSKTGDLCIATDSDDLIKCRKSTQGECVWCTTGEDKYISLHFFFFCPSNES